MVMMVTMVVMMMMMTMQRTWCGKCRRYEGCGDVDDVCQADE